MNNLGFEWCDDLGIRWCDDGYVITIGEHGEYAPEDIVLDLKKQHRTIAELRTQLLDCEAIL